MLFKHWVKMAEGQGWRLNGVDARSATLICSKQGCKARHSVFLDNLPDHVAPCDLPHAMEYAAPVFASYQELIGVMRDRRRSLSLSQSDIDDASGLGDGHTAKIESFARVATFPTLGLLSQTLGLELILRPSKLPDATLSTIEHRQKTPYEAGKAKFKHG